MAAITRRHLLCVSAASLLPAGATAAQFSDVELQNRLAALEARSGGRLGVAVLDTAGGPAAGHRLHERFGLCSTFKLLLAAAVLQHIDTGAWPAERRITWRAAELASHSPVTRPRLARDRAAGLPEGGMTALELAEATQTTSDNTAANVLLRDLFEGPAGFTRWLRAQGDAVTRIDRWEPELNHVPPGEERDTSTPTAIAAISARVLTGPLLNAAARDRLLDWMVATRTGSNRIRAGLPKAWRSGDKTGTAMNAGLADRYNDVAIVWPAGRRAPWVVAAYFESRHQNSPELRDEDEAVLAQVGRLVARWRRG